MKLRWLLLIPFIVPIHAEILIDAIQTGGSGFQCIQVVDGEDFVISNHTTERKAIARCTTEKIKNLDGDFIVKPQGYIRIVVSSDAQAQAFLGQPGEANPPAPASGEVGFAATTYQVAEDAGTVTLTVSRTDPVGICNLLVNTTNGTGASGTDYVAIVNGTDIQFPSGVGTDETAAATITDRDGVLQGNLTFTATLTKDGANCPNDTIVNATATVTIIDQDTNNAFPSGWTQPATVIDGGVLTFDQTVSFETSIPRWTVNSIDGGEIYNTADHFTAPVYHIASLGDVTFSACVTSAAPSTQASAPLAGVMVREAASDPSSPFVFAKTAGPNASLGYNYSIRATTGASVTIPFSDTTPLTLPDGFRIEVDGALGSYRLFHSDSCVEPIVWNLYTEGTASWLDTGDSIDLLLAATATDGSDLGYSGMFQYTNVVVDTATSVDHSTVGSVYFNPTTYQVAEDNGTVTVSLDRIGSGSGVCTLNYVVNDGTASGGTDYTDESGTISWADGDVASKTESIATIDRSGVQSDRDFTVVVSNNSCSETITSDTATVTILDTDSSGSTFNVTSATSTFDCTSQGVDPGDTIVLDAGTRNGISFQNCTGAPGNHITITNDTTDTSPTTIHNAGGPSSAFECTDCEYVTVDGTGKWSGAPAGSCGISVAGGVWTFGRTQCGIKIACSVNGTSWWIRLNGSTKQMTIKGVEIDGGYPSCDTSPPGIGFSINDHTYQNHPNEWREGFNLTQNYVHDTSSECMYLGPNQNAAQVDDLQLRNNHVSYNIVEDCGYDGIEQKSTIEGYSTIHHNYVARIGGYPVANSGNVGLGIHVYEGGFTDVYNNYVIDTLSAQGSGNCYNNYLQRMLASTRGPIMASNWYNNVGVDCKGRGFNSGRTGSSQPIPNPTVYNNTFVNTSTSINAGVQGSTCAVRDNLLANAGGSVTANQCTVTNNISGSVASFNFTNSAGDDYSLTVNSTSVIDQSSNNAPATDILDVARPQGSADDVGAYEYVP